MYVCKGYAAQSADTPLAPFSFERRDPGPTDVQIDILYCGVCHSDIHTARSEWGPSMYPVVPGHEIVGRVAAVGREVRKFKPGDLAGVGCLVDSCRRCPSCREGLEQYCENGFTGTYGTPDLKLPGKPTFGGYSKSIVVEEAFVLRIPENLPLAGVAPLDPVRWMSALDGRPFRVEETLFTAVTPDAARQRLLAALPPDAVEVEYKTQQDYVRDASTGGKILDWLQQQLASRMPQPAR